MTEHDIEINAMDDARREISAAICRLIDAVGILEECEHRARLVAIVHRLTEVDRALYEKIHPRQAEGSEV